MANKSKPASKGREPRGNVAYTILRDRIRVGEYKPGQRIREDEVAKALGMSRTPVRETLRRLEAEGLLSHEPRRGVVVASLDHQMIIDLYVMRETLEGAAASLAARHALDPEIGLLKEMTRDDPRLADDLTMQIEHDRRFHMTIYRSAHNRYLLQALNSLEDTRMLLGTTTFTLPGRWKTVLQEHRAIVNAIVKHNPRAAEAAAQRHIQSALRHRFKLMSEQEKARPVSGQRRRSD